MTWLHFTSPLSSSFDIHPFLKFRRSGCEAEQSQSRQRKCNKSSTLFNEGRKSESEQKQKERTRVDKPHNPILRAGSVV